MTLKYMDKDIGSKLPILDSEISKTNTWSSDKLYNEILGGSIGKKKLLFSGNINSTGTYTLVDNVENYDYMLITTLTGVAIQTHIIDKNTWTSATSSQLVQINYGNGDSTYYANFRLSDTSLSITAINTMNIKSIVGYKLGQVTVQNTITNPSPGESYSTDEQLTGGTWIDGKPIYRKVYNFGALPSNSGKNIPLNINGLKEVTRVYGMSTQGTAYIPLPLSSARGVSENVELYITGGNIVVYTGTDRSDYTKTTIIVEYTKTTDA